jgi:hypothetical protein
MQFILGCLNPSHGLPKNPLCSCKSSQLFSAFGVSMRLQSWRANAGRKASTSERVHTHRNASEASAFNGATVFETFNDRNEECMFDRMKCRCVLQCFSSRSCDRKAKKKNRIEVVAHGELVNFSGTRTHFKVCSVRSFSTSNSAA